MRKFSKFINNLTKPQKVISLVVISFVILFIITFIPTYARYRNRNISNEIEVWDGSVASSYRSGSGSENDPYIISNGKELAYFYKQSLNNDYDNIYFELGNDVVLNSGVFNYSNSNIIYRVDGKDYYVNGNKYYSDENTNNYVGELNEFNPIKSFKGSFKGNSYRICGLYINDTNSDKLGLFVNLSGDVEDLYIENSLIYGGTETGLLASDSTDSSIKNVMVNGFVIGSNVGNEKTETVSMEDSNISLTANVSDFINFNNKISNAGVVISTKLVGNYSSNNSSNIKINNTLISNGSFEINLGNAINNRVSIVSDLDTDVSISNLKYIVTYKYALSGGIVATSSNSNFENVVNKALVFGKYVSSGLIGNSKDNLTITNCYNTGSILSDNISSGLVGVVENSTNIVDISNSYNSGNADFGLVGNFYNCNNVNFDKTFNAKDTKSINNINNSNVIITNSYCISSTSAIAFGSATGNFSKTSLSNLGNKSFIGLSEFVSLEDINTHGENVWVYTSLLPVLYIDDTDNIANINVGVNYSWNNYSNNLKVVAFSSNISFNIMPTDEVKFSEAYYYISTSDNVLNANDLNNVSWTKYSDIVKITDEGKYVIYVKLIDVNNEVNYINTDILVLHKTGSNISIKSGSNNWNKRINDLKNVYVDSDFAIEISASNNYFDIKDISYYASDKFLTDSELSNIDSWDKYINKITYSVLGTYVIYVKVVDSSGFVSYANTDKIIYNGYIQNKVSVLENEITDSFVNITGHSSIVYNFTNSSFDFESDYTHNIVVNKVLPSNTIILINNNVNKVMYQYIVLENDYNVVNNSIVYPFTKFNKIGSKDKYVEEANANSEDFSIKIDFSNTNITSDYLNYNILLEVFDNSNNVVRPTVNNNLKKFNLYNINSELFINSNYSESIIYNSDSVNDVAVNVGYNNRTINNKEVFDNYYNDKEFGLAIKILDSDGNLVNKTYYKNLMFKIGNKQYYVSNDNILRINLGNSSDSISKTLSIITKFNTNSMLENGNYSIEINLFESYDGLYFNSLSNKKIIIPLVVSNSKEKLKYGFNVTTNSNRVLNRLENNSVNFSIINKNNFKNKKVYVSLYKKNTLGYYDQSYSLIDLKNYVTNTLSLNDNKTYIVNGDSLLLDFNALVLEKKGYKFVFELYDGNKKIETVNKFFIVR